jgi:hypothetical protein
MPAIYEVFHAAAAHSLKPCWILSVVGLDFEGLISKSNVNNVRLVLTKGVRKEKKGCQRPFSTSNIKLKKLLNV